jgi:hypothetical protein
MSGGEEASDDDSGADGPALVARVLTFDDVLFVVDAPDDYKTNFDKELGATVAESLCNYLTGFAGENERNVSFAREDNEIEAKREDGSSISISCYAENLFDLQRWPSHDETASKGRLIFDLAGRLNADIVVTLARRFIINGHLDD